MDTLPSVGKRHASEVLPVLVSRVAQGPGWGWALSGYSRAARCFRGLDPSMKRGALQLTGWDLLSPGCLCSCQR